MNSTSFLSSDSKLIQMENSQRLLGWHWMEIQLDLDSEAKDMPCWSKMELWRRNLLIMIERWTNQLQAISFQNCEINPRRRRKRMILIRKNEARTIIRKPIKTHIEIWKWILLFLWYLIQGSDGVISRSTKSASRLFGFEPPLWDNEWELSLCLFRETKALSKRNKAANSTVLKTKFSMMKASDVDTTYPTPMVTNWTIIARIRRELTPILKMVT